MHANSLRVRQWLSDVALPFWAKVGVDRAQGGFTERLMFDGQPDFDAAKRLRVQARQIYVFSHAEVQGLMPGASNIAEQGYDFVLRHGCPDGISAGFVHALDRDGALRDDKRDTYDHAFLLFAFSWFFRATGREDVRSVILELDDAIGRLLRHKGGRGFVVNSRTPGPLHQNPHMHMFEAVLAAWDSTHDERFLDRARELFSIFRDCMFDQDLGVLREFYDASWHPAAGEDGSIVEPGHHSEWVWLLKWYADCVGEPLCDEARRLQAFATRHGRPSGGILMCDQLLTDGAVKSANTRSWPQTEALKAEIALGEASGQFDEERIEAIIDGLFNTFLDKPLAGAWIDWFDVDGKPLVSAIPASTFYHVFLGLSEYLRMRAG